MESLQQPEIPEHLRAAARPEAWGRVYFRRCELVAEVNLSPASGGVFRHVCSPRGLPVRHLRAIVHQRTTPITTMRAAAACSRTTTSRSCVRRGRFMRWSTTPFAAIPTLAITALLGYDEITAGPTIMFRRRRSPPTSSRPPGRTGVRHDVQVRSLASSARSSSAVDPPAPSRHCVRARVDPRDRHGVPARAEARHGCCRQGF